ncbi:MAG: hypothetical protein JRJ03_15035 [Deltaproteobacteria bacterium]|nr:hypothetical protein [Deltaproteobacteria bacterium]
MGKKVKILFLCTGNSFRSHMAEAWARHLKGNVLEAHSAGVNPKGVDPRTRRGSSFTGCCPKPDQPRSMVPGGLFSRLNIAPELFPRPHCPHSS